MRYKFMYWQYKGTNKIITVLDFKLPGLIHFDLEYLQSGEAPEELKTYMRTIWKSHVENSAFEYKGIHHR